MSPPERPSRPVARGITPREDAEGETLDERLEQEEPDPALAADLGSDLDSETDPTDGFEVGDERTGRLAQEVGDDDLADDVGIDGGAASAEEAAMHTVEEDAV